MGVRWTTAAWWAGVRRRRRTSYSDAARKVGDGTKEKDGKGAMEKGQGRDKMRWDRDRDTRRTLKQEAARRSVLRGNQIILLNFLFFT
jgi:hypothetical protein